MKSVALISCSQTSICLELIETKASKHRGVWQCSATHLRLPFEVTQLSVSSRGMPLDTLQQNKKRTSLHINTVTSYIKNVSTFTEIMQKLERRFATHERSFMSRTHSNKYKLRSRRKYEQLKNLMERMLQYRAIYLPVSYYSPEH